jgi:hypothetical protein
MTAQGMNRYSHRAEDRLLFLAWDLNQDGHDVSLPILIGLDAYSILAQGSDTNICARQTTCPACLGPLSEGCIPDRRQHDPVTHTIKPPRCSLPYPLDDTPLGLLNKWMYSFRTFQDQQHQQQILSRPTRSQYSEVSCSMENYRSNAFPFGLGWRKSPHESPHTHTSLFPIPIAVGDDGHDAPSGYHPSSKGVT